MALPDRNESSRSESSGTARLLALKLPVRVHNVAMTLVAAFAVIYFLQWAKPFLVPLLLGILIAY